MGALIAKFRKEKSIYEVLEKLEFDIKSIQDYSKTTELQRRSIVTNIGILSVSIYVIAAALIYQYFLPPTWLERLLYVATPLLVFPFMVFAFRKTVVWYYDKQISKNASKLMVLREKKRKILEEVMEKKTYKEAQKILERFDEKPVSNKHLATPIVKPPSEKVLAKSATVTTTTPFSQKALAGNSLVPSAVMNTSLSTPRANRVLPRPLISLNRSILDKMVDYIIGDGPSYRYALICINCHNHNGMAFKEEFEFLAFRCAFCSTFNPAKKQRPVAPTFDSDESRETNSEASDDPDAMALSATSQEESIENKIEEETDRT